MLIYTPNAVPKSMQDRFKAYIPEVRFRKVTAFKLYEEIPKAIEENGIKKAVLDRVYTKKCFLQICNYTTSTSRVRSGGGYCGDYDETIKHDGVHIILYLGSPEKTVRRRDLSTNSNYTLSGERGWGIGEDGKLRTDLEKKGVQDFIFKMLEDEWAKLLQLQLY